MEQEYQNHQQRCSNSSSERNPSCKKLKNKMIPKRGLGVAQLEKMRLEEHQKKAPPCFVLPLPHPSIPPSNPIFNQISSLDLLCPAPPTPTPLPHERDHGSFPEMWNSMDLIEPMFPFRPPHNDFNPVLRSSMVNVSTSPSSSSGFNNLQMEPPSNQIYYNNSTPSWLEEERMVGKKRLCPISLDDLPGASSTLFQCKFPPFNPSFESSRGYDGLKFESLDATFRETPSNSIHATDDLNLSKTIKENGSFDGSFLSLGPLAISSNPKSKKPRSVPTTPNKSEFDLIPFQGSMDYPFLPRPFYSFLPPGPSCNPSASSDGRVKGDDGVIDLNLKL